jgi:cytochrome c oxidase subunit IV
LFSLDERALEHSRVRSSRTREIVMRVKAHDVPIIHFIVLCTLPVITAAYAWRFRGRQTLKTMVTTSLIVVISWYLSVPFFMPLCGGRSNPVYQVFVPPLCALVIALVVGKWHLRWSGFSVLAALFVFLMDSYQLTVHGPHYVGDLRNKSGIPPGQISAEWHTPLTNMYRVRAVSTTGCRVRDTTSRSS